MEPPVITTAQEARAYGQRWARAVQRCLAADRRLTLAEHTALDPLRAQRALVRDFWTPFAIGFRAVLVVSPVVATLWLLDRCTPAARRQYWRRDVQERPGRRRPPPPGPKPLSRSREGR